MSQWLSIIVALAVVSGVLGMIMLGYQLSRVRSRERFEQRMLPGGGETAPAGVFARLVAGLSNRGEALDRLFDDNGESERLIRQSGWRRVQDRRLYFAVQAGLPALAVAVLMGGILGGWATGWREIMYLLGLTAAALLAPRYLLRWIAGRRRMRLRNEVPMFIHLLALLFDAGLSLRQALVSLVRDGQSVLPELGREIQSVLRQLEAGAAPAEALRAMGQGLDVPELNSVLGVLRQMDRYGGELRAPLMDVLAVVEERRHLSLREKVNALSGRMTVVMVLFFFPALLVFVAGPAFLAVMAALGMGK